MVCGRSGSLSGEGVSVPRPRRARPGARPGPRDGGGRGARRRIVLRGRRQRRERQYEGDADRGKDCVAHCHFPTLFADGAKRAEPLIRLPSGSPYLTLTLSHRRQMIGRAKRGVSGRGRLGGIAQAPCRPAQCATKSPEADRTDAPSALHKRLQKMRRERVFMGLRRREIEGRHGKPALAEKAALHKRGGVIQPADRDASVHQSAKGG